MTRPYLLVARLAWPEPAELAIQRVAEALSEPFAIDEGEASIGSDDVRVRAVEVERSHPGMARILGFDADVVVEFPRGGRPVCADVVRTVLRVTAVSGSHGVLFEDFADESVILRVDAGRRTLNERWPGWRAWPEVLGVVPVPFRFAVLGRPH
jgi:hypothetical protein